MSNRENDINEIVSHIRQDLKDETRYFLNHCTNKEIQGILDVPNSVVCLEIERIMCKLVLENRISIDDVKSWEINEFNSVFDTTTLDYYKKEFLPNIRKYKIDKLTNNDR